MTYHEWRWRSGLTPRRPDKPDKQGQGAYDAKLAGVPAHHTLDVARALFASAAAPLSKPSLDTSDRSSAENADWD
jgi:hypothetical protein